MKNFDISSLIPTSLEDVRRVAHSATAEQKAVTTYCTLVIRKSGKSIYTYKKHKYTASADTVLLLAAGTEYSLSIEKSGECTVVEFNISAEQLQKSFPEGGIFEYSTSGDKSVYKLAKNLLQYYVLRGPAYYAKCFSELYSLIAQISTVHAYNRSLAGKYGLIHASVKFIEANYARPDLYTPMLAEMSQIGETYYRSIFQSVFNMAPAHYIQLYRVGKAKELLLSGAHNVEEIAVAVGFANSSYFCKVFKSLTHTTPSEFAQKCKALG